MYSSALNVLLSNGDVVANDPCILGMVSCLSKESRLMVASIQAEKRYNCQLASAVVKGRISLGRRFTDRRAIASVVMELSHTIGSFVKCSKLLAAVDGHFTIDDVESIERSYASKTTEHPLAFAAQAKEIRRFLGEP
jgi:hypothetical protein